MEESVTVIQCGMNAVPCVYPGSARPSVRRGVPPPSLQKTMDLLR